MSVFRIIDLLPWSVLSSVLCVTRLPAPTATYDPILVFRSDDWRCIPYLLRGCGLRRPANRIHEIWMTGIGHLVLSVLQYCSVQYHWYHYLSMPVIPMTPVIPPFNTKQWRIPFWFWYWAWRIVDTGYCCKPAVMKAVICVTWSICGLK